MVSRAAWLYIVLVVAITGVLVAMAPLIQPRMHSTTRYSP